MTEQQQAPIPYAEPSTRSPRPTRHSVFTTLSLLVPISAVALKGVLLGYAYWRWQTWTMDRLSFRILEPFGVIELATFWFLLGAVLGIVGLIHPGRRHSAALVAFLLNAFFLYGQTFSYSSTGYHPSWSW